MWLSPHFHLSEFTTSQTASRMGISNQPSEEHLHNLAVLANEVLERIREAFQAEVVISSGYRSPALNAAVKGSKTSQHCSGQAADIEIPGLDNCELALFIVENLDFDQVILEFHNHEVGPNDGWVHVSFNADGNRRQVLTAKRLANGRTKYFEGLI